MRRTRHSPPARAVGAGLALAALLVPAAAVALMPPHIRGSDPEDGEMLVGDTIELYGYSLRYVDLDEELEVVDETAGEPAPHDRDLECEWTDATRAPTALSAPGERQLACTLEIALREVTPCHEYRVSLLNTTIRVEAAPRSGASTRADTPRLRGSEGRAGVAECTDRSRREVDTGSHH